MTTRHRLLVLTDIAAGLENDDVQSMTRLLLYADVIDLGGSIVAGVMGLLLLVGLVRLFLIETATDVLIAVFGSSGRC